MRALSASLVLCAAGLWGCPSLTVRGSARTLEPGRWEVNASLGAVARSLPHSVPGIYGVGAEAGAGVGLTPGVEAGLRLISFPTFTLWPAVAADVKVQLLRSSGDEGVDVAIAPTVSVDFSGFAATAPLLVDLRLSPDTAWAFSLHYTLTAGAHSRFGVTAGYRFRAGPGRLRPELGVFIVPGGLVAVRAGFGYDLPL